MAKDLIESIASVPNVTDDFSEVWMAVRRSNGLFVERMAARLTAIDCEGMRTPVIEDQIFMDSTISFDNSIDIVTLSTGTGFVEVFTDEAHGFSSGESVVLGCTGIDGAYSITTTGYQTVTNYWPVCGLVNSSVVDSSGYRKFNNGSIQPAARFDLTAMYVKVRTAPGTGKFRRFTVYKNGVATGLSVTISGTETTGNISNTVSFNGSLTDYMCVVEDLIAGATDSGFSIGFNMRTSVDKQVLIGYEDYDTNLYDVYTILHGIPVSNTRGPLSDNNGFNPGGGWPIRGIGNLFSSSGTLKNYEMRIATAQQFEGGGDSFDGIGFYPDAADIAEYVNFSIYVFSSTTATLSTTELLRFTGPETGRKLSSIETDIEQNQFCYISGNYSQQAMNIQEPEECMEFYPDESGHRVFNCNMTGKTGGDPQYNPGVHNTLNRFVKDDEFYSVVATKGTIKNLIASCYPSTPDSPSNSNNPTTITIRKNLSDTVLTCTIGNNDTSASDLINSFTVEPGDLISVKCTIAIDDIGSAGIKVAWTFVADNPLETPVFLNSIGEDTTSPNTPTTSTRNFIIPATNTNVYTGGGFVRETATIFEGLDHLEGETVSILADGVSLPATTVTDGSIVTSSAVGILHVGLPIVSDLETLNIELGSDLDSAQGRKIKVGNVECHFTDSKSGYIGDSFDDLYHAFTNQMVTYNQTNLSFNEELTTLNTATVLHSGWIRVPVKSKYKYGGRICLRQIEPYPLTLNAIIPEISVGGAV